MHPGVRLALPRVVTGLARSGNRVEAPELLARLRLVRGNESANAEFTAAHTDDDLVFHHQRRMHDRIPGLAAFHLHLPPLAAGGGIDRDEIRVDGPHEQRVAKDGQPAIVIAAAVDSPRGRMPVDPEHSSRRGIERDHVVRGRDGIHHAVDDQRRRLERRADARLIDPARHERGHVAGGDLRQRRVALVRVVAAEGEPVPRVTGRREKPRVVDDARSLPHRRLAERQARRHENREHQRHARGPSSHSLPSCPHPAFTRRGSAVRLSSRAEARPGCPRTGSAPDPSRRGGATARAPPPVSAPRAGWSCPSG